MTESPAASVIIVSYRGRQRIDRVLRALTAQDVDEPFEIIAVLSGDDETAHHIRSQHPHVSVLQSSKRLRPGPARNRGVEAARGQVIAFLPDDGEPAPDWLARRLTLHKAGNQAVGGAIVNAFPASRVASAVHLLEYSSVLPYDAVLEVQEVPHCLSFSREVFETVGRYPEDTITGEDTLFNLACKTAGISFAFSGAIRMQHRGSTSLGENLRHAFEHGRGLMQCSRRHGLDSIIGVPERRRHLFWRAFVTYPLRQLAEKWRHISTTAPEEARELVLAAPVMWLCLVATGAGAVTEWRTGSSARDAP